MVRCAVSFGTVKVTLGASRGMMLVCRSDLGVQMLSSVVRKIRIGRMFSGILVAVLIVSSTPPIKSQNRASPQSEEQDAVKSFKKVAADFIASYEVNKREWVRSLPGDPGWKKVKHEVGEYSIDVRRTDSLISPYVGVLQFSLKFYITASHPTREEAERDVAFKILGSSTHEHTYVFQDEQWVIKLRKHRIDGMVKLGMMDWYECDRNDGCW